MRHLALSVVTTTVLTFAFAHSVSAQARVIGEVQAITPCDLYAATSAPLCPQVMIPIKTTLRAISIGAKGARKTTLLRSDADGHLSGTLPRPGRYRLTLRSVETSSGHFSANTLKIVPNNIRASSASSPTLFLVSHRSRPSFNVGISYGK